MPEPLGTTALTPGFMIVHGNRLDDLRDLAVSWMRRYPLAPLESERVLAAQQRHRPMVEAGIGRRSPRGRRRRWRHRRGAGGAVAGAVPLAGLSRGAGPRKHSRGFRTGQGAADLAPDASASRIAGASRVPHPATFPRRRCRPAQASSTGRAPGRPVRPVPGLSRRLARRLEPGPRPVAHGERAGAPARCRRALAGRIVARAARRRRCR